MTFHIVVPPADLSPWIEAVLVARIAATPGEVLPLRFPALVGSMLAVTLAGRVHGAGVPLPTAAWSGPSAVPKAHWHRGPLHTVALLVRPAAASGLLGAGASVAVDRVLDLADVWPNDWPLCEDAVRRAATDAARVQTLCAFVRGRVGSSRHWVRRDRLHHLQQLVRVSGDMTHAASAAGVGARHFERLFFGDFGLPPKVYQRVARLENALRVGLATQPGDGAGLALRHGYYDQSHLGRDLRELAGGSLTTLRNAVTARRSGHWTLGVGAALQRRA